MIRAGGRWTAGILVGGSILAAAGFAWPLFAAAVPRDAQAAVPIVAFALVPALVVALALTLDREMYTAKTVALLGVLSAVGAAVRIAGTGVGGVEAVFVLLVLAGRAYGARFGFLLGLLTIAVSSMLWGGFGPWTPFQMFASAWSIRHAARVSPVASSSQARFASATVASRSLRASACSAALWKYVRARSRSPPRAKCSARMIGSGVGPLSSHSPARRCPSVRSSSVSIA